ncbi:MAG TPA: hypothetical protein VKC57_11670 [Ktedonobacterales bacterium]|nr:hypothetical protein [Ktedonobacterales bacterium]
MSPPAKAICRDATDIGQPCQFADICDETRQRLHHYATPPITGQQCYAYQHFESLRGSDAQQERAAIQSEGA